MTKTLAVVAVVLLVASAAGGQSLNSARTSGLTSVISRQSGNTFTWMLHNNTGSGDGEPGWGVLVWSLQPFGMPEPVRVQAPNGWGWVARGHGRFEIESPSKKYESPPAIPPGGSLVFMYEVDPLALSGNESLQPEFVAHVGAVRLQPTSFGGVTRWTAVWVDGESSWFDVPDVPEPTAVLPVLLLCTAAVSLTKKIRR